MKILYRQIRTEILRKLMYSRHVSGETRKTEISRQPLNQSSFFYVNDNSRSREETKSILHENQRELTKTDDIPQRQVYIT